jgi:pimeloyl-ACP methyl ester carboxylesterase
MNSAAEKQGVITSGPYHMEYMVYGNGENTVLAFHGFDNDAEDFLVFKDIFKASNRFVCINLFYHGRSSCDVPAEEANFTPHELKKVMDLLFEKLKIDRFSLLGYSLGGRVCLQLLTLFPERVVSVMLLAPDGLKLNRWYRFLTSTQLGRKLFQRTVNRPAIFMKLAKALKSLRLIGEKQLNFAVHQFDTIEKRRKVYAVWMIFRYLMPDHTVVLRLVDDHAIRVELYFGKRDTIIPVSFAKRFQNSRNIKVHTLDAGHYLMKSAVVESIHSKTGLFK